MRLAELDRHKISRVVGIETGDADLEAKLREIGFAEGDEIEVLYFAPLGHASICVRLNETLIALRRPEAHAVYVEETLV
ncbi:MAG: FeoA family protein [Pseudomonadota bacterium]